MKHLVVPRLPQPGSRIVVDGEQFHYLRRVRRVGEGDTLRCTDGRGTAEILRVVGIDGESMILERPIDPDDLETAGRGDAGNDNATGSVTLAIALLKGKKFDTAVRQATELGIDTIVPVITKHCVSRPTPEELEKKRRRWIQIALEASQQSGRTILPEIAEPRLLTDLPEIIDAGRPSACAVVFHEAEQIPFPRGVPEGAEGPVSDWHALIGPEGGLAPEEISFLAAEGWLVRRLHLPVLRAETAVIAAGALVQHLRSEYNSRFPTP
ncbi:MAG: RsmE family RNA methyltransferase [Alkalispirochaeta sp.]